MNKDYEKEEMLMDKILGLSDTVIDVILNGGAKTTYQMKDLAFTLDYLVSAYSNLHDRVYRSEE